MMEKLKDIHENYAPFRPHRTPFPIPSVLAWYLLLDVQRQMGISGNVLEIGVEHGGTAFLLATEAQSHEKVILIDRMRTQEFDRVFSTLPTAIATRVDFHLKSSHSQDLNELTEAAYRFIHIDGGHRKSDVISDFNRFANTLQPNGLICLDDIFTTRWPGVTEAVFEVLPSSNFTPLMFVDRKLYVTRKDYIDQYRTILDKIIPEFLQYFPGKLFIEPFFGSPTIILRLAPHKKFAELFCDS